MDDKTLVAAAFEAREHAYTPYSHWAVGAALLTSDDTVYGGCNIENAAYTPSNCGGPEGQEAPDFCAPCGVCRQVMREFCSLDDFRIILGRSDGQMRTYTLRELLPESFGPENLA